MQADWYRGTALDDLLGIPSARVNDDRLYRGLDQLLVHKQAIETPAKLPCRWPLRRLPDRRCLRPRGGPVEWTIRTHWDDLQRHTEGAYVLRTNIDDWSENALSQTYIQLTDAEAAFRIHKTELSIRPIWHQKKERVQAHIFVCVGALPLWH